MSATTRVDPRLFADEATDHIRGPASAYVTVIEYGDFECPSCLAAYSAMKVTLDHFESRIRFVFRHYPLRDVHPHAELAAEASEAAGAQGKFWPMHALLFSHQQRLKEKHIMDYAIQVGVDMPRFQNEMKDRVYLQRVQEHMETARHLGVRTAPSFYVNGIFTDVSSGLHHLHEAIDTALTGR